VLTQARASRVGARKRGLDAPAAADRTPRAATLVASRTSATYTMSIPNNTVFLGYQWKAQSAAMAPGYNPMGFITSNGCRMTVGN
jgi:hypothetical protein